MSPSPEPARYVLESRRLRFREMQPSDLDLIFSIFGNPVAMRYFPAIWTREECAAAIERNRARYAADGHGLWIIERKDSGQPIGDCGVVRQQLPNGVEVEVGYHLHPDSWGLGFATEAASRCMTHAFERLKCKRIISLIRPENGPSRRVAERNGLLPSGEVEWHNLRHIVYAMTHEDWLTRRR